MLEYWCGGRLGRGDFLGRCQPHRGCCCVGVGVLVRRNRKCNDSEAGECLMSFRGRERSPWLQHIVGRDRWTLDSVKRQELGRASALFILKTTETALVLFPLLLWGAGDGTEGLVPGRTSALPRELHSSFAMAFELANTLESAVRLKKQAEIGMEAEANSGACFS